MRTPSSTSPSERSTLEGLPDTLRPFFWEYDFDALSWERDRDLITRKLLESGDWNSLRWLRGRLGDAALAEWLRLREGAGLSPRQLRLWELALDLPKLLVDRWIARVRDLPWEGRRAG
jgi:hypothetical protein